MGNLQAYDGEKLRAGQWVAVVYNKKYFLGQVTEIAGEDSICVNYLAKKKSGEYVWPKKKDTDTINCEFIFCSQPRMQQVGNTFVLHNEEQVGELFKSYTKKFMS